MANTLTSLIPTIYESLDIVSREWSGMTMAVARNTSAERAALNQSILVPITQAQAASDNTPGVTSPDTGDQTIDNASITISRSKYVPVRWNGEQTRGMQNAGTYDDIILKQFAQGFRTLVNLIEADLCSLYPYASRAYGTAGTTPFGTAGDLSDVAGVQQILDDNGAPTGNRRLVFNSAALANLRGKQNVLFKVNESGTDELLRRGTISELEGMFLHTSAGTKLQTKGTGTSYQSNNVSGYAVGATSLAVDTGTGTILAGDVLTATGDTNKYIVGTALSAGSLAINNPGLQATLADNVAVTVGNSYRANLAFDQDAIQLVVRPPALPQGGDSAEDSYFFLDDRSGITFEIALYKQFLQNVYHIRAAWGYAVVKPAHTCILLG